MKRIMISVTAAAVAFLLISCKHKVNDPTGNLDNTVIPTQTAQITAPVDITGNLDSQDQTADSSEGSNETADIGDDATLPYSLAEASYFSDDVIKIYYPQISGLSDKGIQDKINENIKTAVMKYTEGFDAAQPGAALDIDYAITWKGKKLLSLQFIGFRNSPDAAYPSSFVDTLNIDIKSGEKVTLSDMVKLNESFLKLLKEKSETKYYYFKDRTLTNDDSFSSSDVSSTIKNYVFDGDNPVDFGTSDSEGNTAVSSYFTGDSVGISVPTIHAYGDHIEFEIKYKDIMKYLSTDNSIWNDFPEVMTGTDSETAASPTPEMSQQEPAINEEAINKNTNYVPGFYVIKDQSFWTEFENWGKVFFITAAGEGEFSLNSLYLYLADQDSNILYEFPYFYGNGMSLDGVKAVSFQDVNNDGLKDIIVIADYMTGVGPSGAEAFPVAGVYFQKGKEFVNQPDIDEQINSSGENTSINKVTQYLKGLDIQLD